MDTSDTAASVTNSTFANNTAVSEGGGIYVESNGNSTFTNCTITANRAKSTSSGVGGGLMALGAVTLHNTIVAGNFRGASPSTTADDVGGTLSSASSFNLIGTGGSGKLVNGVNNNQVGVANAGLGTLATNGGPTLTIALLAGSPAIDHGSNTFVVAGTTDQRGLTRIANGTVDIGAYEAQ
jgi:parallel beta-helix repeat protein